MQHGFAQRSFIAGIKQRKSGWGYYNGFVSIADTTIGAIR